jgi:pimeloyl-ACP methyl ester carboxylesterase
MFRKISIGISILLLIAIAGFLVWAWTPLGPSQTALDALQSDTSVTVNQEGGRIIFQPAEAQSQTGFIFYPGGRVDFRSYSPLLRDIAEQGYLVVLVRMPLNLAVLGSGRAEVVIEAYPEIQTWAIGGHSLGGAMAANFAFKHPDAVQGLVLWASYPSGSNDLSSSKIQVISIYGSRDGVINQENLVTSHQLLPPSTQWVIIQGGNHAGFGSYGDQPGDNPATISAEDQQAQVAAATTSFLESLQGEVK